MKVDLATLLQKLELVSPALTTKPVLEQSSCFVFSGDKLLAFDGKILIQTDTPLPGISDMAVGASLLLKLLSKFPDERISVTHKEGELRIRSGRRTAGIVCDSEVVLPFGAVPVPVESNWEPIDEKTILHLKQAVKATGGDENSQYVLSCVRVRPDSISSSDTHQLYYAKGTTGFMEELLLPSGPLAAVANMNPVNMTQTKDWCYFQLADKTEISVRCVNGRYPNIEDIVRIPGPYVVDLPSALIEMLGRADVMVETGDRRHVDVEITEGSLCISARRSEGWYRETEDIVYTGEPIAFMASPSLLKDLLGRSLKVSISQDRTRMLVCDDDVHYLIALLTKGQIAGQ